MAPARFFCCLNQDLQDSQDEQDFQDETQLHGAKVWKPLMSIERRRNMQKRSDRTLIVIASEAGFPGFTGFSGCRFLGGAAAVVPVVRGPVPRCAFSYLKQDFQDFQDFQDGTAQECGAKV